MPGHLSAEYSPGRFLFPDIYHPPKIPTHYLSIYLSTLLHCIWGDIKHCMCIGPIGAVSLWPLSALLSACCMGVFTVAIGAVQVLSARVVLYIMRSV